MSSRAQELMRSGVAGGWLVGEEGGEDGVREAPAQQAQRFGAGFAALDAGAFVCGAGAPVGGVCAPSGPGSGGRSPFE